jgi:hypothetical protein
VIWRLYLALAFLSACSPVHGVAIDPVAGQDDRWMLMERKAISGLPLVVLARVDNPRVSASLDADILTEVRCKADQSLLLENEMPSAISRIYALEDALADHQSFIKARALHVASITGEGVRRIVYSRILASDAESIVSSINIEGFSCRTNQIVDRKALSIIIVPTDLDRQLDGDMSVISNLKKEGDLGNVVRRTDFFFIGEESRLKRLASSLTAKGFQISEIPKKPGSIVLYREMAVDFSEFQVLTPSLLEAAKNSGVTYDGWETFVVRAEQVGSSTSSTK